MRSQGGRAPKRKAETNFVDAYSGASELPPPPTSRDVHAVPAKLRNIMRLKSLMTRGARNNGQTDTRAEQNMSKVAKKSPGDKNAREHGGEGTPKTSNGNVPELSTGTADHPAEKRKGSFARKWKKREEDLKRLVEKMDKREKIGIKHGVSQRRKRFLSEKKKKRKGNTTDADSEPPLNRYDRVEFGEIVQAPPKLLFPRKAAEVKEKVKLQGHQAMMMEKMRLEAIESYRKRKESSSSSGQHLRLLNFAAFEK